MNRGTEPVRAASTRSRGALWALVAVVTLTLGALVWFHYSMQRQMRETIVEYVQSTFPADRFQPRPPAFFGEILRNYARAARDVYPEISRLVVVQELPEGEAILYPDSLLFGGAPGEVSLPSMRVEWPQSGLRVHLGLSIARYYRQNLVRTALAGAILILAAVIGYRIRQQEKRIVADSVELRTIRGELATLERRALIGQVTASLIHDLKKPVLHIRDESESSGDPRGVLQDIRRHAGLFLDMLRDLKLESFLAGEHASPEYVYLDEIVEQSLRLVRREANRLDFVNELPSDLPLILAVPHRLVQVFSNLFLNSIEAMNGNGRIRVSGRLVTTDGSAPRVEVTVEDDGPGIPPEVLPRVFDPFYSAGKAEKGCGLGLYICRNLLEEMGGSITAGSTRGGGARFILYLRAGEGRV